MKTFFLFGVSAIICGSALAEASSPWNMNAFIGGSSISEDLKNNESMSYQVSLGYYLDHNIGIEAGYSDYLLSHDELDYRPGFLNLKASAEISDVASFYFGAGVAYQDSPAPLVKAGIQYQLSDNWKLDAGYQRVFDVEELSYEDVHAFFVGGSYRFGEKVTSYAEFSNTTLKADTDIGATEAAVTSELTEEDSSVILPVETVEPESVCKMVTADHIIQPNEYLIGIAEQYDMTLSELLDLNNFYQVEPRHADLVYPQEVLKVNKMQCSE